MPAYACDECNKAFRSKAALQEHLASHSTGDGSDWVGDAISYLRSLDLSPRNVRRKLTFRNIAIMFGVVMMATLFTGTALYMSSYAPSGSGGITGGAAQAPQETTPPTGRGITKLGEIPSGETPGNAVLDRPLSGDQQVFLLAQGGQSIPQSPLKPAVLIQYNCETPCPDLVANLTQIAEQHQGWVYVAPNPELNARIVATAFQRLPSRYDTVRPQRLNGFICDSLGYTPISCAVGR